MVLGAHSIGIAGADTGIPGTDICVAGADFGMAASYMGVAGTGTGLDTQCDIPVYIPRRCRRRRRRGSVLAAATVVLCAVGILKLLTCWRSTSLDPYQHQVWPQVWPCGAHHIPDFTVSHQ